MPVKRKAAAPEEGVAQLNMTPMIDVVFQLLIFFIVGMEIRVPEGILNSHLPKDRGPSVPDDQKIDINPPELKIRLVVDKTSSGEGQKPAVDIYFEQYRCADIPDLENKLVRLGEELASIPIIIDGAPEVPFDLILRTLNACVKAKFTQISFKAPPIE
jgi:biopolymer transport protein ExbD